MEARRAIKTSFHVNSGTTDKQYLNAIGRLIEPAVESFKPEFILYNAGTDIAEGDQLGGVNVDKDNLDKRLGNHRPRRDDL